MMRMLYTRVSNLFISLEYTLVKPEIQEYVSLSIYTFITKTMKCYYNYPLKVSMYILLYMKRSSAVDQFIYM